MFDKILYFLTGFGIKVMKRFDFLVEGLIGFYDLLNFTRKKKIIAVTSISIAIILTILNPEMIWLIVLAPIAFVQNLFFTLVSRSRNSHDTNYHRFCAWGSNGVWFICQVMIVKNIWAAIERGDWIYAILAGIVYSLATTEGSVLMMKHLIATEKGKRRVGANDKIDKLENRIIVLERMIQTGRFCVVDAISKEEVKSNFNFNPNKINYRHGYRK